MQSISFTLNDIFCHARIQGGGGQGVRTPQKNHKHTGFLRNTGQDSLKNHIATKPAFNVGPSSACQRNTIKWRFAGGPMMARL